MPLHENSKILFDRNRSFFPGKREKLLEIGNNDLGATLVEIMLHYG